MDSTLLDKTLTDLGQPNYRRRQIYSWLARGVSSYEEMTDLSKELRGELIERVPLSTLSLVDQARSKDGTVKALFETTDGRPVEAVLMTYKDGRRSICVSSQSGCPLTCTFCATGQMKFGRNLTASEIIDQALHFRRIGEVNHAVFMGMGEPMMNLEAVLKSCEFFPEIGITNRRTAVSTVGWIPGIEQLTEQPRPIRLALSLHAPDDDLRSSIMPINERYPLEDVLAACRNFYEVKRRKVFIEYVMLGGVNDRYEHAAKLAEILEPWIFKVNLIPFNPTGSAYEASNRGAIEAFKNVLTEHQIDATVRLTRGQDIDAACGQLAAKKLAG